MIKIGLVGDFNESVPAHRAIPIALGLASESSGMPVEFDWIPTDAIDTEERLVGFHGIWCVPASPYRSMEGAIRVIRFAREQQRPFLGTCGGFQHAVIEYARNVLGWRDAEHAEISPDARLPVIAPLQCALVDEMGSVRFRAGSRLFAAYGMEESVEEYRCSYGLNPEFQAGLIEGPLQVTARDSANDVRGLELNDHPFFVLTLFQPERAALRGILPPLWLRLSERAQSLLPNKALQVIANRTPFRWQLCAIDMQKKITDDLDALLDVLPVNIRAQVRKHGRTDDLLEIIIDLGRVPTARYLDEEIVLSEIEVQTGDIDAVVKRIGEFDEDNRAGLEWTLHRISAIRNRRGQIVGLTCRVGRAVYGTIDIIEDMVESGKSVLLLGRPGVGKTTLLREGARVLAGSKRVVIVDTSNEIGGDGDIPHPAVGKARRMQVSNPSLQHEVMIEAVENHSPEVIIIDEIGREMEATAARTIAERGVQLIGTAHGNTLDNIMLNPTLADLVGGIESVTLSDEEARRRGTQKTVLERRSPPTFDVLIEIQERDRLLVHPEVADAVDAILRGRASATELRYRDESGEIHRQTQATPAKSNQTQSGVDGRDRKMPWQGDRARVASESQELPAENTSPKSDGQSGLEPYYVYAYGITRSRLEQVARRLRVPLKLVDDLSAAQALVTLKSYYRRRQRPVSDAEAREMPIYVLRSNTAHQMENFLLEVFGVFLNGGDWDDRMSGAVRETRSAIEQVMNGLRTLDLAPQEASIRRRQHQLVREARLISHSYGREPNRRVRIFRE